MPVTLFSYSTIIYVFRTCFHVTFLCELHRKTSCEWEISYKRSVTQGSRHKDAIYVGEVPYLPLVTFMDLRDRH